MIHIRKSTLIAYMILLFPLCHIAATNMGGSAATLFSYYDELVGCISVVYIAALIYTQKLPKEDHIICGLLCVLTVIGLLSNWWTGVERKLFSVLVDIVFLWKPIAVFLAFKNYAIRYRMNMIRVLFPWAKFSICLNFALCIIGRFIPIGVMISGSTYVFLWKNPYQTAWLIIGSLMIIGAYGVSEKKFLKYLTLSLLPLFSTNATMVWAWIMVEISMIIMLRKNQVFKKRYIIFLALILFVAFFTEVSYYLLSRTGPRARLLKGAFQLAAEYFPLGTGFATYGSEMASRDYSPVYISMGWEYTWGLGREYNQFINDNFFASILAQFGWLGFVVYMFIQMYIYNRINTAVLQKMERVTAITTMLIIVASMIGSASAKSVMGVCVFGILGLLAAETDRQNTV